MTASLTRGLLSNSSMATKKSIANMEGKSNLKLTLPACPPIMLGVERSMDPLFGSYPRLGAFLSVFLPDFRPEKREFNQENADRMIACLIGALDALFKAENL